MDNVFIPSPAQSELMRELIRIQATVPVRVQKPYRFSGADWRERMIAHNHQRICSLEIELEALRASIAELQRQVANGND